LRIIEHDMKQAKAVANDAIEDATEKTRFQDIERNGQKQHRTTTTKKGKA